MHMCSSLRPDADLHLWNKHNQAYAHQTSDLPAGALIAPAANILQLDVFHARQRLGLEAAYIDSHTIARQNGLIPAAPVGAAPISNHCVAMSLNFIKKFRAEQDIRRVAQNMQHGADVECARGTMLYDALRVTNKYGVEGEDVLLNKLKNAVANIYGLALAKEITLEMPLAEMVHYFNDKLSVGEYLMCLPNGHIVTLIKNGEGLFLFDANQGTIDLKSCDEWCKTFLEKYRVSFTESLRLIKVEDQSALQKPIEKHAIHSANEPPPQLIYRPLDASTRWEIAEYTFRDKTYHFVKDKLNGYVYNDNSKKLLRFKFCLLTPRNLIDTSLRTIYHVAMTTINLLKLLFSLVRSRQASLECWTKVKQSAADILRAPFYGVLGTLAAFYGIFKPYEGRALYGYLERCLNRQNAEVNWTHKYYVAPCFVPLNFNLADRGNAQQTKGILKKYALRQASFGKRQTFDLFCGWAKMLIPSQTCRKSTLHT